MKTTHQNVLITGAAGALGRAFAMECAARGWSLMLTDVAGSPLERFAAGIRRTYGVHTTWAACNLVDADGRREFLDGLRISNFRPTMLINVAGLDYEGAVASRERDELLTIIRLNIEATTDVTHAAIELSQGGHKLRVVTVSSLAAFFPMPLKATYAASKRYLLQLSLSLREELRSRQGSATALCPAGLPTREDARRAIEAQGLIGRLTTVDVNRVVAGTLNAALRGRALHIPGALNRVLRATGALLPETLVARLVFARWSDARDSQGLDAPGSGPDVELVA